MAKEKSILSPSLVERNALLHALEADVCLQISRVLVNPYNRNVSRLLVTLVQNFFFIQEKIRLKYKISYEVDGSSTTETGEVDSFPSVLQG